MNILILGLTMLICGGLIWLKPEEGPGALAVCALASAPTLIILARTREEKTFLMRLFMIGVLVRIVLATVIFAGHMEEFFGGDANTYDIFGQSLLQSWHGNAYHRARYEGFVA